MEAPHSCPEPGPRLDPQSPLWNTSTRHSARLTRTTFLPPGQLRQVVSMSEAQGGGGGCMNPRWGAYMLPAGTGGQAHLAGPVWSRPQRLKGSPRTPWAGQKGTRSCHAGLAGGMAEGDTQIGVVL